MSTSFGKEKNRPLSSTGDTQPKQRQNRKKLVGAIVFAVTIFGAIAAMMVVPEFRRLVRLDPPVSDAERAATSSAYYLGKRVVNWGCYQRVKGNRDMPSDAAQTINQLKVELIAGLRDEGVKADIATLDFNPGVPGRCDLSSAGVFVGNRKIGRAHV